MIPFIVLIFVSVASVTTSVFMSSEYYHNRITRGRSDGEILCWALAAWIVSIGIIALTGWIGGIIL